MAAVPQLYSVWKSTLRLSQLSRVAEDLLRSSQTQSKSARARDWAGRPLEPRQEATSPARAPAAHGRPPRRSGSPCPGARRAGHRRRAPRSGCRSHRRTPRSQARRWGRAVGPWPQGRSLSHCAGRKGLAAPTLQALHLPSARQWLILFPCPEEGIWGFRLKGLLWAKAHSWPTLPRCHPVILDTSSPKAWDH